MAQGFTVCAAVALAVALVAAYWTILQHGLAEWNATTALSKQIVLDIEREASSLPDGSLLVVGAPREGINHRFHTWKWAWALPYALQPPFTPVDLTQRLHVIGLPEIYCCPQEQWLEMTRREIAAWSDESERPPVVALAWDPGAGALRHSSSLETPILRTTALALRDATSSAELTARLASLIGRGDSGGTSE